MRFRIYADESGTHDDRWLIIGLLFVPDHGALHADLCRAKDEFKYFNTSPRRNARYRETHLADFRSNRDIALGRRWIQVFMEHLCYYRCVVVDWEMWDSRHFGTPFEPEALKKRRAYKKWTEMLLHAEVKSPTLGMPFYHAQFYLDRLRILYGYDVLEHIRERFTRSYRGFAPFIEEFQHTDSWRDANQCLQLCDLLTGCQFQSLVPSRKAAKAAMRQCLADALQPLGIRSLAAEFWRQFAPSSLNTHCPKFSAWFWRPSGKERRNAGRRRRRG